MYVIEPFTFPCGSTNSNLKVSQICSIDWIIYHCIAFIQLLLFMGCNICIFLFYYFVAEIPGREFSSRIYSVSSKFNTTVLYLNMVIGLIHIWIITATGMRWWPSRDHLSHLVPLSIKNTTLMKCR